ncbi:hypothetical protein [Rhodovulum adriaticum]|uniref:Sulfotransferase family protein n=1 Tax=Rhodovulum adriaticum TaxID=35804 RepID=A0A4R2NY80_RHOAD|nr:hypothetical protein [Rhodovulum adriaticum]MBK1634220.1 hypothetical protein [Rhodovulum adriaticum]TCP27229.1 hypothetical protein EV656_101132 [Rhodovulum adriaticum]
MAELPRIVVHAGMHKTGSTAIQEVFGIRGVAGVDHPGGPRANLSDTVLLLFAEGALLDKFHATRMPHLGRAALLRRRDRERARIEARLRSCRAPVFLFSAEDIAAPDFDAGATARMAEFLSPHGHAIEVIAYVRGPVSFMQSAYQQRVKQDKPGAVALDAHNLWPGYRARFEKLDQVFGRDKVHLRAFDTGAFREGDVVLDFADALGVNLADAPRLRANDGLSREAMSVAYCRLAGLLPDDYPTARLAARFRATPARAWAGFGTGKFTFSDAFLAPALAAHRADMEWIEDRLGRPLPDRAPDPNGIGTAADMQAIAQECRAALATALDTMPAPPTRAGRALRRVGHYLHRGLGPRGQA